MVYRKKCTHIHQCAERYLKVPKLLDGEDLVDLTPDKKSMYTYLMEYVVFKIVNWPLTPVRFYRHVSRAQPVKPLIPYNPSTAQVQPRETLLEKRVREAREAGVCTYPL